MFLQKASYEQIRDSVMFNRFTFPNLIRSCVIKYKFLFNLKIDMYARVLDGRTIMRKIISNINKNSSKIPQFKKPCLGIVQGGSFPNSNLYVNKKIEMANLLNFDYSRLFVGKNPTEDQILSHIQNLNLNENIDGIILLFPIVTTNKIDVFKCLNSILPSKDIEGLGLFNTKNFERENIQSSLIPCSAASVYSFITMSGWKIEGLNVYLFGNGITAGR